LNLRICLFIVTFLFAGIHLPAQSPYIHHYTTADGLPSNTVYYVFQDSKKFIWFATDAGVARFDGSRFDYFTKKDGLSSNEVVRIQEDSFGRIWFFNLNGTINFVKHNKIYNERNAPFLDSLKSKEFFRRFFQDEYQTIYFYYNHQGDIIALDSLNNITKYRIPGRMIYDHVSMDSVTGKVVRYLSKAETGDFIIWTVAGIFLVKDLSKSLNSVSHDFHIKDVFPVSNRTSYVVGARKETGEYGIYKYTDELLTDTILSMFALKTHYILISSIIEDINGLLWISTFEEGLFCLQDNRVIQHFEIKEAQALIQDHENNIWISSMCNGVYKINPIQNQVKHYSQIDYGVSRITAMDIDPLGGVWCTDGVRVFLFRDTSFYQMDFQNNGGPFNRIHLLKNNKLIVWQKGAPCYTFSGLKIDQSLKKIFYNNVVRSFMSFKEIVQNHCGDEVVSFLHLSLLVFTPERFPEYKNLIHLHERIYNIFYNPSNILVVNASKNYIYRNGLFEISNELSRFDNKIVTNHLVLNDSVELINIEGESLFLFTKDTICSLTEQFRYSLDSQIKHIVYDEPRLYLTSINNVFICEYPTDILNRKSVDIHPIDLTFRNIHDILIQNESLYIATDDGLTVIPDSLVHDMDTYLPIPYFQSILINDHLIDPDEDQITLKGNNRIDLFFGSKSYSDKPVIYSYILEGLDPDWITNRGTNVVYKNLPPGVYVFKIRARKPTSMWSEPVEYRITIKATIWQHPLFFIGLSLLFAVIVALVIIRRKNLQLKQREIDHQLITLEQKALQSMMNPHFIFNALSSIQSYLLMNKSREAGLYLSQFARLIRQNLSAINSPMISLDEEIDRLKNYLDLEQLRMADGFDYAIELDESVVDEEVTIPSMIIQPFAENAIIHGISPLDRKGIIRILLSMHSEKSLMISIEDNGIGLQRSGTVSQRSEKHLNLGMGMTRKRLEILGKKMNVETSVEFKEAFPGSPNPGTRVTLVVPVGE